MAKNIFEFACFGKQYKTRDGRKAIYQREVHDDMHTLMFEKDDGLVEYWSDGDVVYEHSGAREQQPDDIVAEWKDEISEQYLDKLADKYASTLPYQDVTGAVKDFKAGCRAIIENTPPDEREKRFNIMRKRIQSVSIIGLDYEQIEKLYNAMRENSIITI